MKIARSLLLMLAASSVAQAKSSSYWALYPGNATADCVVIDGEMVNDDCCKNAWIKTPPIVEQGFNTSCFVIPGLLGDGGGSLMSYLGCDGDQNTPTYGEDCYGETNGIIPDTVIVENTDPENAAMCGKNGCQFLVKGNGCQKIRDFSSLPGFENDTRQVFLFMDEHCPANDDDDEKDKSSASNGRVALLLSVASMVALA